MEVDNIKVITTYKDVLSLASGNILALDISQNSTGIAFYVDGIFETRVITVPKPEKEDAFYDLTLAKNFIKELYDVIPKVHYKTIVIEDIYGAYVNVYKILHSLAIGFEMYLQSNIISYDTYYKLDNRSWKSSLRKLAGHTGKVYLKDKADIQESLRRLGLVAECLTEQKTGIQDQLDASGLLLTAIVDNASIIKNKATNKLHIEFYTEEQYKSLTRKMELIQSPYGFEHKHTRKDLLTLAEKENNWYTIKVSTTGALGIKKGFIETIGGPNYLVFKRK